MSGVTGPMTSTKPFYERTIADFSDEIITKAFLAQDGKGWYASLDVGPYHQVSDPDFTSYSQNREDAIAACANWFRNDQNGIGKYAPHFDNYDRHFRLQRWWHEKELMGTLNPNLRNEMIAAIKTARASLYNTSVTRGAPEEIYRLLREADKVLDRAQFKLEFTDPDNTAPQRYLSHL